MKGRRIVLLDDGIGDDGTLAVPARADGHKKGAKGEEGDHEQHDGRTHQQPLRVLWKSKRKREGGESDSNGRGHTFAKSTLFTRLLYTGSKAGFRHTMPPDVCTCGWRFTHPTPVPHKKRGVDVLGRGHTNRFRRVRV